MLLYCYLFSALKFAMAYDDDENHITPLAWILTKPHLQVPLPNDGVAAF